jgi:hypothetical protein
VKGGDLVPTKIGKKTLFAAPDIASLLNKRRGSKLILPFGGCDDPNSNKPRAR